MNAGEPTSKDKGPYLVIVVLSIAILGLTGVEYWYDTLPYHRFLGNFNPLMVFVCSTASGAVLLSFLHSRGWFIIYKKDNLKPLFLSSCLAALLAVVAILADLKSVFPFDMNVSFPASLIFYPTIGFLVEMLFHIIPLSVLLISLTLISKKAAGKLDVWVCILIVSLLEPLYQAVGMHDSNRYPLWIVLLIGANLFIFNMFQLLIFKRYDFISMYSCRLAYYMVWHIVWGHIRLKLLF